MNKLRTILESPFGRFLVDAEHDGGKVQTLAVHPILDEKIGVSISKDKNNWKELIDKLENILKS